jgi:hypothetical protein
MKTFWGFKTHKEYWNLIPQLSFLLIGDGWSAIFVGWLCFSFSVEFDYEK